MLVGKFPVALVLARNAHDGPGAVAHQHVVGHPDRGFLAGDRVPGPSSGIHAASVVRLGCAGELALARSLAAVAPNAVKTFGGSELLHQRMLRRQGEKGGAEDRVGAGTEHPYPFAAPDQLKLDLRAHRAADPVALHLQRGFRPVQAVEPVQQPLGVLGDPQHPLPERPAFAGETAHFRTPFHDFLVGQGGAEFGAPPHRLLVLVGEPAFVELEEYPLRPAVVVRVGGAELARPVVREPE